MNIILLHFRKTLVACSRNVYGIILIFFLCGGSFLLTTVASTTTLTVTVVYDLKMDQWMSSSSFLNSIGNTNDPNVYITLSIPSDALNSSAPVFVTMYSTSESAFIVNAPLPSGKLAADTFYNFSFINADTGSSVTSFDKPATLSFFYSDSDISGMDESTIAPYRWDGSSWSALGSYTVDTAVNKVTVSTQNFSTFALMGSAPSSQQSSPSQSSASSGGGGGGGGGGIIPSFSGITLSGKAYPKSTITVLKDAQIAATTVADPNANFSVSVTGISSGNYIFSVYSEDEKGNRSSLLTFPVSMTSGATVRIGGIFIAPTIALDKSEVKKGSTIAIFGQSTPESEITIYVHSEEEFFNKVKSDTHGIYLYNFDTTPLSMGEHIAKSKAAISNEISSFSKIVSFIVGTKNTAVEQNPTAIKGDVNGDRRINLVDFSITAYWYKRPGFPAHIDLNNDGTVNLVDFSIMAYYWSG